MDLDENPEMGVTSSLLWLQRDLISISLPTTTLNLKIQLTFTTFSYIPC